MEMNTMTEPSPQIVKSYLAQLERALDTVPQEVAREIINGVAEELSGLDATAASERIELLGDPVFIAAEARAEAGAGAAPVPSESGFAASGSAASGPAASGSATPGGPRWYTVLASLLVALGGVLIPVLGWVMGLAMVWLSKTWHRWEKWVATLLPPVVAAFAIAPGLVSSAVSGAQAEGGAGAVNPLLPSVYSVWSSVLLVLALNVVVGVWLLWRGLRRSS